jgi:hypothetical protein
MDQLAAGKPNRNCMDKQQNKLSIMRTKFILILGLIIGLISCKKDDTVISDYRDTII